MGKSGMTLAEVMVAVGILSIGLLALVLVQSYAARARSLNQGHLMAAQLAGSEIARIQELASGDFERDFRQADVEVEAEMFVSVDVVDEWQGNPSLKAVTVTVAYPSGPREKGGRTSAWVLLRAPD
jgi:prepilin-type N-terminal cleavage/methylation domain-containing protein